MKKYLYVPHEEKGLNYAPLLLAKNPTEYSEAQAILKNGPLGRTAAELTPEERAQYQAVRGRLEKVDHLDMVDEHDTVYVFGHGNLGVALGGHEEGNQSAPDQLAEKMKKAGLKDVGCKIKLLACNSGVRMQNDVRCFAVRFAKELINREYTRPQVYGYIGFVQSRQFIKKDNSTLHAKRTALIAPKEGIEHEYDPQYGRAKDRKIKFTITKDKVKGKETHELFSDDEFYKIVPTKSWWRKAMSKSPSSSASSSSSRSSAAAAAAAASSQ